MFKKPKSARNSFGKNNSEDKKSISKNILIIIIAISLVAGYFVGTNSGKIAGVIAPAFGYKTYTADIDLSSVEATFRALKANYDGNLSDSDLITGANKGLVDAAGDKYTVYMDSAEVSSFSNDLSGNIGGGIGAEISLRSSLPTIIRVLSDNPAQKAGLMAGDTILKVNNDDTTGWSVEQTVLKIRGDVGTTVKLTVKRGDETKEFSVTRDTIIAPSVDSKIEGTLGILTVSRFDSETATLARSAAKEFVNKGVKSVILDLRGNGGGYVDAAQALAGLWLDNEIVVVEKTNGKVVDQLRSGRNPLLADMDTVVLVDGGSASASEIVSGAMQDYKVAKLIGTKTYGKGSVQQLISLPDGAQLKVTVARWYTPNGKNINQEGVAPDISVDITSDDINSGNDPQLDAAKKQLGL